jgi:hypothetical protein
MEGEDRRAMLAAMARLPRRQREVLALRYYLTLTASGQVADLAPLELPRIPATILPGGLAESADGLPAHVYPGDVA